MAGVLTVDLFILNLSPCYFQNIHNTDYLMPCFLVYGVRFAFCEAKGSTDLCMIICMTTSNSLSSNRVSGVTTGKSKSSKAKL